MSNEEKDWRNSLPDQVEWLESRIQSLECALYSIKALQTYEQDWAIDKDNEPTPYMSETRENSHISDKWLMAKDVLAIINRELGE